ncbi:MAG: maleylacetoacetate isomerase [Pseudomonadota bacterium]|jgi:maleylpyruvate isomerase
MITLHGYFRSGAAYRTRIALNFKGIPYQQVSHHLRKGEQRDPEYLKLNPQALVPALVLDDGTILTQSLAIIEWLEETHPEPALLPKDPIRRAKVRAFALAIAADTHPVQNLRVLQKVAKLTGDPKQGDEWGKEVNLQGLAAAQKLIEHEPGPFCFGNTPTLADVCLVPQLGNVRRYVTDLSHLPRLVEAEAACKALKPFQDAAPENQPDAE